MTRDAEPDRGSRGEVGPADALLRGVTADGRLRVVAVTTTSLTREGARRHGCVGAASVALGRALTAGLCLATLAKGEERVTLQIAADGPLGGVTVDATGEGDVRGYLSHPAAFATGGGGRRTRLAEALGRTGVVNVLRDLGLRERYGGQCQLVTGEIDEDVEAYLRQSEQIESALGCEVLLADAFTIAAASGVLVQSLPLTAGGDEEAKKLVRAVQHRLRTADLYEALAANPSLDVCAIAEWLLADQELQILDVRPVRFACRCSRERVSSALALLGGEEIDDMIAREGRAEILCNFCNERYALDRAELQGLRAHLPPRGES